MSAEFDQAVEEIEDLFCVGEQPLERWRPYVRIDDGEIFPKGWTLQGQNDELIAKRRFHARTAYQYMQLADVAKAQGWYVWETLRAFELLSVLETRLVEISLANFQILTGTVGVDNRGCTTEDLYLAAMTLHATHLHLHDLIAQACRTKKNNRKEVMGERPSLTDGKNRLARAICEGVRSVNAYCQPAYAALRARSDSGDAVQGDLETLAKRFKMTVRQLDKVLKVVEEEA
jgi:hypothetical protein